MTFNGYVQKQSREGQPWLQDRNFFRFTSLYVDLWSIQSVSTADYYVILKNFDEKFTFVGAKKFWDSSALGLSHPISLKFTPNFDFSSDASSPTK